MGIVRLELTAGGVKVRRSRACYALTNLHPNLACS
jgi:hypothetical protein